MPMIVHASHARPDSRYRRTKRTSETMTIQTGKLAHHRARPSSAGVVASIMDSSQNAMPAVPAAVMEMSKLAQTCAFGTRPANSSPPA